MAEDNNIGGAVSLDITDFRANMANLNRDIRVIESGFRATAAGLGDWGQSAEGLQAKINSLNGVISAQEQKVQNLRAEYQRVVDEQGENSRSAQELTIRINNETTALERNRLQLRQVTERLENFETQQNTTSDSTDDLSDSQGRLRSIFGNVKEMGLKLGGVLVGTVLAGVTALAGGVVKGISSFDDMTKSLNGLQAETGTADKDMSGMKDTMLDLYKNNFGESFADIGKSMGEIAKQSNLSGKELGEVTKQALTLKDTFGFEVNESFRSAKMLMDQFGISSTDAYNLIAQGAQSGLDKNGDLLDTINEYSVQFKTLGFNSEEMFNMLKNGAESGTWSVDKLGDAVKEFGIRAKDGSKGTTEAFESLGLNSKKISKDFAEGGEKGKKAFEEVTKKLLEIKDPLKQNSVGVSLFGTMWEDLGAKGIEALTKTKGGISSTKDALDKINEVKYNSFGEALAGIGRQLEVGILIPIGQKLVPALNDFAKWFVEQLPTIQSIGETTFTALGDVIAGVVTTIQDLTRFFTEHWNIIAPILAGILAGATTFGIYSLAMSAVTIATTVWTTVTGIATGVMTAFGAVLAFVTSPIGIVVLAIGALIAIGIALYKNWDTIKEFGSKVWEKIKETWDKLKEGTIQAFSMLWEKIKEWSVSLLNWAKTEIPNIITNIINFFSELPGKIGYAIGFVIGKLVLWASNIIKWIIEEVPKIISAIFKFFSELPSKIYNTIIAMIDKLGEWVSKIVGWVKSNIPKIISAILYFYVELPIKIFNALVGVIVKLGEWVLKIMAWAKEKLPGLIDNIVSYFKNLPGKMVDIGKNIVEGIWKGITNTTKWLKDKMNGFADGIIKGIKESMGIHSPSTVFRDEVGKMIGLGMAEGIDDSTKDVKKSIENLAKETFEHSKKWIDKNKSYNNLSVVEELAAWQRVQSRYLEGTQEREEADKEVYRVKKQIHEKLKDIEDDYFNKVTSVNDKLKDEIAKANQEYENALKSKEQALYNFSGIFDEVSKKEITGDKLITNLESQVGAFSRWSRNIKELAQKGVDEGLIQELKDMGPKTSDEINALNSLSSKDLTKYVKLWKEKHRLAKEQSVNELEGLKIATTNKIKELTLESTNELSKLKTAFDTQISDLTKSSKNEFENLVNDGLTFGSNLIKNLISGIDGQKKQLQDSINSIKSIVSGLDNANGMINKDVVSKYDQFLQLGGFGTQKSNQDTTINLPIYLDGRLITNTTSKVQAQNNLARNRALGVVIP